MGDGADLRSEEDFRKAHNAERDLHRTFKRAGLSLPIPIRSMDHTLPDGKQIQIDYVQPSDWLSCLIKRYPALLAGGRAKLTDQLRGFWDLYSFQHGDHAVFKHHANDLERVFPLQFWGDEGRGPKRAGWLAGTIESCLGLDDIKWKCCCERKLDDLPRSWLPTFDGNVAQDNQYIRAISNVGTNYKGHSFLTRYLLFGIPGYLYGSKSDLSFGFGAVFAAAGLGGAGAFFAPGAALGLALAPSIDLHKTRLRLEFLKKKLITHCYPKIFFETFEVVAA